MPCVASIYIYASIDVHIAEVLLLLLLEKELVAVGLPVLVEVVVVDLEEDLHPPLLLLR